MQKQEMMKYQNELKDKDNEEWMLVMWRININNMNKY